MVLKKEYIDMYNQRMEEIEKDIWDIIDNFEYYKKIRGIMFDLKRDKELSKRQTIRLYEFIMRKPEKVIKKTDIDNIYNLVIDKMFDVN